MHSVHPAKLCILNGTQYPASTINSQHKKTNKANNLTSRTKNIYNSPQQMPLCLPGNYQSSCRSESSCVCQEWTQQCEQDRNGSAQGTDRPPACHEKRRRGTAIEASSRTDMCNLHITYASQINNHHRVIYIQSSQCSNVPLSLTNLNTME